MTMGLVCEALLGTSKYKRSTEVSSVRRFVTLSFPPECLELWGYPPQKWDSDGQFEDLVKTTLELTFLPQYLPMLVSDDVLNRLKKMVAALAEALKGKMRGRR